MYKRVIYFILFLLMCSCTTTYTMYNSYSGYYKKEAIDSICTVEKIPKIKMGAWNTMAYVDGDTGFKVEQFSYVRNIKESKKKTIEESFICTDLDTIFKFNKRILVKEK